MRAEYIVGLCMLSASIGFVLGALFTAGRDARRAMTSSNRPPPKAVDQFPDGTVVTDAFGNRWEYRNWRWHLSDPPPVVGAPAPKLPSIPRPPSTGFAPSAVTTPSARSVCVCGHGGESHKQTMPHPCEYHGCDCPHFLRRISTEAGDG